MSLPILLSVIGVIVVLCIVLLIFSYHVAPTDTTLVVTGLGKRKFVTGKSVLIIPFIYRIDKLYLGTVITALVSEHPIPTKDAILIDVSATANFRIDTTSQFANGLTTLDIAARNYLNQNGKAMERDVTQVLMGKMREIIGKTDLKDLMASRDSFVQQVTESANPDMAALGLTLVTFNVRDFTDHQGVINNMGASMAAEIQRDANIAQADAQQKVAERRNILDLRVAALKSTADEAKAKADMVYEITKASRTKELNIAKQEAQIADAEKQATLAEKQAEVKEQELNATVRKQADADLYAAQQRAEADLFTKKKNAEAAKIQAEANAEVLARQGEGEANATKARGTAEADVIRAKGESEASAIDAQGKAYNAMQNPYILLQKYIELLPQMIESAATPLSKVDSITMYGEGNASKLVGDTTNTLSQVTQGIEKATGIKVSELLGAAVGGSVAGRAAASGEQNEQDEQQHDKSAVRGNAEHKTDEQNAGDADDNHDATKQNS